MNAKLSITTAVCCALLALSPIDALSQSEEETLITATRTPLSITDSLRPVSVLDRADIETMNSPDLGALLARLPGFDLGRNGGVGAATSLFLRGGESNHTLLLIDGVRMDSLSSGIPPWHAIPLAQVERIEVVRGPRSSLYGSDALGGIVQIFTRRAQDRRFGASFGLGSRQRQEQSLSASLGDEDLWFNAHIEHENTEGIDNFAPRCSDRDAWRSSSAKLGVGARAFGGEWRLDYNHIDTANEYDSSNCNVESKDRIDIAALNWGADLSPQWSTRVVASYNEQRSRYSETERLSLSWQNDLRLNESALLSLGADWRDDENHNGVQRYNIGAFAQLQYQTDGWRLAAAWRFDDDEQYGNRQTGSVDFGLELGGGRRLTLSVGEGFKAPTFGELYSSFSGNPDLKPEESRNYEIGLRGGDDDLNWRLFIYDNDVKNLINYDFTTRKNFNTGAADIRGVEWLIGARRGPWSGDLSLNWLDATDADTGLALLRRAERKVQLRVNYQTRNGWTVGGDWLWRTDIPDIHGVNFGRVTLGGYSLFNFGVSGRIQRHWRWALNVDNALDKNYEAVHSYPGEDIGVRLSLRWNSL